MVPRIVHFEMAAADKKRAKDFYSTVFDWTFEIYPEMDYTMIYTGKDKPGIDGGFADADEVEQKVVLTIDVEDIDQAIKAVEANGGTIALPKTVIPRVGYLAYFIDTEGNMVGMMQEDKKATT